jgi:hypothetical protein
MLATLRRVALPALLLLLAGGAAAQDTTFDDQWFKLKVRATGYLVAEGEHPQKGTATATAYLHLRMNTLAAPAGDGSPSLPSTDYTFEVWTDADGHWSKTYESTVALEGCDGRCYFVSDMYAQVALDVDAWFESYFTGLLVAKRDKAGNLVSATFRTLGAEICDGGAVEQGTEYTLRGGASIKGKTVPVAKLPFTPPT